MHFPIVYVAGTVIQWPEKVVGQKCQKVEVRSGRICFGPPTILFQQATYRVAVTKPCQERYHPLTYEIIMFDHCKYRQELDMLQKWNMPTTRNLWAKQQAYDGHGWDDIIPWREEGKSVCSSNRWLTELIAESWSTISPDLIHRIISGRMDHAEYDIERVSTHPIWFPLFNLPHAEMETMKLEIVHMVERGIIIHSIRSFLTHLANEIGWCHKLFCVDY